MKLKLYVWSIQQTLLTIQYILGAGEMTHLSSLVAVAEVPSPQHGVGHNYM